MTPKSQRHLHRENQNTPPQTITRSNHIATQYGHEKFFGHNVSNKKIPVARQIVNRNNGYAIKECKAPNTYSTYFNC